jgi:hypothetical protein
MRATRKWRTAVAANGTLIAVIGLIGLGLAGASILPAGSTAAGPSVIAEVPGAGIFVEAELLDSASAPPDPACQDCPKRIPGEPCTRISCDPCCYRCTGDPIPWCY